MDDVLPVPVVSPEGLVVLKLFAWHERHETQPRKDAADLAYVLHHYCEVVGDAVLFDQYLDLVEEADYDLDLAAARVLGRKIAASCRERTRALIQSLLSEELDADEDSRLLRELATYLVPESDAGARNLIRALHLGLDDPKAP